MKVLLLHQFGDNTQFLSSLVSNLRKNSIEADSFNIVSWKIIGNSKPKLPIILRLLKPMISIPKVRGILLTLFQRRIIIKLVKNYQIIDIHFFSECYDKVIPNLKKLNKKIKITVWGSDFYRADMKRIKIQRSLYYLADVIQVATERMKKDFTEKFPEYKSKVRVLHFGNSIFDIIKKLDYPGKKYDYRKEFGIPADKITLTCGYNGSKGQQHLKIIDAITKLDPSLKNNIYLLLPMTYGTTAEYLREVKGQIDKTGLPYRIFTTLMNANEVAKLRLSTDIVINIQVTDALSASVQEHIMAGNILIAGDWLPYDYLQENMIYHFKTNIKDLPEKLSTCLLTLDLHMQMAEKNKEMIFKFSSWDNTTKDWVSIYNELTGEQFYE